MTKVMKHIVVTSFFFGLYGLLVLLLLNPFSLFPAVPFWNILFTSFGFFILLESLQLFYIHRLFGQTPAYRWTYAVSFIISTSVTGITTWILFGFPSETFLFYSTSFFILSLLPASASIVWLTLIDLQNRIQIIQSDPENTEDNLLKVTNDKGKILMELSLHQVLCFEANDNYVIVHYLESNNKTKAMHRISLRKISESLEGLSPTFERVHKSFLINPGYVEKVEGKVQAYRIRLQHMETKIPVSRSFDISKISV